ncbi:MFS transporter [Cystobacter fuscus]|uniref:MFS transporter n=1 Tax=Cystobacter fuscus TaxID=43 RepID=UPI002B3014EE|nr:MFS transporter [Cystobacter fuscus]
MPWSPWLLRVVVALGITWILDGLEVTLVGSVAGMLGDPRTLHLSESQIGFAASAYLFGAIVGALVFGRLTDSLGRKKLFLVTLAVYTGATLATAFSWGFWPFVFFRALTGAGIGGEYSAINSAIDELMPAHLRGRVDLTINSTYWLGAGLGSASTLVLLNPNVLPPSLGWRVCFALGGLLGFCILFVRKHVPESPRWLLLHGREKEAEAVVASIEAEVERSLKKPLPPAPEPRPLQVHGTVGFGTIARVLFQRHLRRSCLGLSLMVAQAFAYNAIFFTYALILGRFYGVPSDKVGLYLLPFAAGNLLGPIVLGRFFDTVGRRQMIALTYGVSGILLCVTGYAFMRGWLTATTQTALWCCVFFVASAAASSAYLTVSELFPVELRGMAIALFYAVGTAVGGLAAPAIFGALIQTGERVQVFRGYLVGGALMMLAALVAAFFGVPAEGKSLEALAEDPSLGQRPRREPVHA